MKKLRYWTHSQLCLLSGDKKLSGFVGSKSASDSRNQATHINPPVTSLKTQEAFHPISFMTEGGALLSCVYLLLCKLIS